MEENLTATEALEEVTGVESAPEASPAEPAPVEVVDIQFRPGQKIYYFDPDGLKLQPDDHVVIDTARGPEFGYCAGGNHLIRPSQIIAPLRKVIRQATPEDDRIAAENREKEKWAYEICAKKIAEHKLDMQLVSAEYAFDGSKIVFYFTADERVDFRDLVKNLAGTFHVRIELRQIGVRDKAKMVGGLGICGRPFCCASFLADFQPVSIKMAKTQNLSLNPTKISGTCGRLMCCLKYEQDAYEDLLRTSPKPESFVDTPDGRGTVVEVNLLRQKVRVRMEKSPETVNTYVNGDIAVLRSGKGKKTDPPIPEDLAPISGAAVKRERQRSQSEGAATVLEPVKFKYRMDDVAEERTETTPATQEPQKPRRPHRSKASEERNKQDNASAPPRQKPHEAKSSKAPRAPRQEPKQETRESARPPRSGKPRQSRPSRPGDQIKTLEQPQRTRPPKQERRSAPAQTPSPEAGEAQQAQKPRRSSRKSNYHRSRKPQGSAEPKTE